MLGHRYRNLDSCLCPPLFLSHADTLKLTASIYFLAHRPFRQQENFPLNTNFDWQKWQSTIDNRLLFIIPPSFSIYLSLSLYSSYTHQIMTLFFINFLPLLPLPLSLSLSLSLTIQPNTFWALFEMISKTFFPFSLHTPLNNNFLLQLQSNGLFSDIPLPITIAVSNNIALNYFDFSIIHRCICISVVIYSWKRFSQVCGFLLLILLLVVVVIVIVLC